MTLSAAKASRVIGNAFVDRVFYNDDLCIMLSGSVDLQQWIEICYV